ncbi:CDP-alcohol phosphatidyltransferase family protein [Thermodesulfobacteriota bacterium]
MNDQFVNEQFDDWKNESVAETRRRLRRSWGDYPLTILILNPINIRLARLLGHTLITPNQITVISFMLTILASILIASNRWGLQSAGGAVLLIAYLFDCLDGDLARLKGLKSPLGAMLDPMLDRFGEFAICVGISINGWYLTKDYKWLIGGMVLVGMSQIYFYLVDAMLKKLPEVQKPLRTIRQFEIKGTIVRIGAIEPFIWGQAGLSFLGVAHWGVIIFGVMFSIGSIGELFRIIIEARNMVAIESERYGTHLRCSKFNK